MRPTTRHRQDAIYAGSCLLLAGLLVSPSLLAQAPAALPSCASLLSGGASPARPAEVEAMIAQSWLEMMRGEADPETSAARLATLLESLAGTDDLARVFSESFGSTNPAFLQALSELSAWTQALTEQGQIDRALVAQKFRDAIRGELREETVAADVTKQALEARSHGESRIHSAEFGSSILGRPLALPNGKGVVADRDGRLHFFDSKLNLLATATIRKGISRDPIVLGSGRILVVRASDGELLVYNSDGTLSNTIQGLGAWYEPYEIGSIPDGGVIISADNGSTWILDADGVPTTPGPVLNPVHRSCGTLPLDDGSFWFFAGKDMIHFLKSGEVIESLHQRALTIAIGSLARFADGSLVASDWTRRVKFLNADGSLRRRFWIRKIELDVGARPAYPLWTTRGGKVGVASEAYRFLILDPNGSVFWQTDDYDYVAGAPIEVAPDRFLFRNKKGEFVIDGPGASGPKHTHAANGEALAVPPQLLPDGTVAIAFEGGRLQILNADGILLSEINSSSPLSESPALLKDGTLILVTGSETLRSVDPAMTAAE